MQKATQDNAIRFRAPAVLVDALASHASRRGMTLSEFMRSIAREKVGLN